MKGSRRLFRYYLGKEDKERGRDHGCNIIRAGIYHNQRSHQADNGEYSKVDQEGLFGDELAPSETVFPPGFEVDLILLHEFELCLVGIETHSVRDTDVCEKSD